MGSGSPRGQALLYVARRELRNATALAVCSAAGFPAPRRANGACAAGTLAAVNAPDPGAGPSAGDARLTHVDARGRANMVDVSHKAASARRAIAHALVELDPATRELLLAGRLPKGEALAVARVAGIQAAKDTARLIPLCHPLALSHVAVEFEPAGGGAVRIVAEAATVAATGVEMEAMTAAAVAALAVYDMVKGRCRAARITEVRLVHKSGGKSGTWDAPAGDALPGGPA